MSAFLCTPEHLAQLAIAYCEDRYEKAEPRNVVLQMLSMNEESLKSRYRDSYDIYNLRFPVTMINLLEDA